MKKDIIINLNDLNNIVEINIEPLPNQEFTTTIYNLSFTFEFKTFNDNKTFFSAYYNDITICNLSNIKTYVDYFYFSNVKELQNLVLFFGILENSNMVYNYENLGNNLRLYFGTF